MSLPVPVVYGVGAGLEAAYRLLGRADEPRLTRFLVRQLATAHWFDITAARRDLGYAPQVSIAEGLHRLHDHLARPTAADRDAHASTTLGQSPCTRS